MNQVIFVTFLDGCGFVSFEFRYQNCLLAKCHRKSSSIEKCRRDWMCFYCHKNGIKKIQHFVFATVDEAYDHWKLNHGNGDEAKQKPFRFYSVDLLRCSVDSCSYPYRRTFQGLHRHHQEKHSNDLFVPIFNGRCALCLYTGNDLHKHACQSLQNAMQLNLYNPIVLTEEEFMELLAVGCQESKQHRTNRIECQHCDCIFGSRQEMIEHHQQKHGYDV